MDPTIEPRHLRSALEFAVAMAAELQRRKPAIPVPSDLKRFTKYDRIPTAKLATVAKLVDTDPTFRERIAVGAVPELVDPIGLLWLQRPDGWQAEATRLVTALEQAEHDAGLEARLRRADKQRQAAEQATLRATAEVVSLSAHAADRRDERDQARADADALRRRVEQLELDLREAKLELRHANDRVAAAKAARAAAEAERDDARAARGAAETVRDEVLADRTAAAAERAELARLAEIARNLAAELTVRSFDLDDRFDPDEPTPVRNPLTLPGSALTDTRTKAAFLLGSGASILIDGYNVAKLGWPQLSLAEQRRLLLERLEALVRRSGCDVTVVFDGADVVGASADRRRLVRVVFSPAGVSADDVLRDEVARLPASRAVVVVTNDRAIVNDVVD